MGARPLSPIFPSGHRDHGPDLAPVARLPRLTEVRYRDGCRGFTGPFPPPLWMRYSVVVAHPAGWRLQSRACLDNTVTDRPSHPATGCDAIHLGLFHMTSDPSRLLIVASNRGPVSYSYAADGSLAARRGGGGMVSGLTSGLSAVAADGQVLWVCAALSAADRAAARGGDRADQGGAAGEVPVRMLDIPVAEFTAAYNG